MNFIKTKDRETADKLKSIGLNLVSFESGVWTFLNCKNFTYADINKEKITYTNMINL